MKLLDKRFQFEEQVLMQRDVANIKASMLQIVEQVHRAQLHQIQFNMLHAQMQQMAQRVLMLRQRCHHVWEQEYHLENGTFNKIINVCAICEAQENA